jgi:uncharacterized membrane protein YGL010W
MGGKPLATWIEEYSRAHQHPVNRACHLIGVPTVALSTVLLLVGIVVRSVLPAALILFAIGWTLQIAGHIAERKPPEFLRDPRFLLVGLRWWWTKVSGGR